MQSGRSRSLCRRGLSRAAARTAPGSSGCSGCSVTSPPAADTKLRLCVNLLSTDLAIASRMPRRQGRFSKNALGWEL